MSINEKHYFAMDFYFWTIWPVTIIIIFLLNRPKAGIYRLTETLSKVYTSLSHQNKTQNTKHISLAHLGESCVCDILLRCA